MKFQTLVTCLVVVQEADAYSCSSGPLPRTNRQVRSERTNYESDRSSSSSYFGASPRSNRYRQRQSRVNEAFRELQKEMQDDGDRIGAATTNSDSFFINKNIGMAVDKEMAKKWVERGFDFASDFNEDFATTSQEREMNGKILKKSRAWVDRVYKITETKNSVETDSNIVTDTDTYTDNDTEQTSDFSTQEIGDEAINEDIKNESHEGKSLMMTPNSENMSNDEVFQVAVDLPGVERSNIDITFEDDVLSFLAARKPDREGKPERIYEKRFALAEEEVIMDHIKAVLNDGVLVVTVPKKKIETKPKLQIKIS